MSVRRNRERGDAVEQYRESSANDVGENLHPFFSGGNGRLHRPPGPPKRSIGAVVGSCKSAVSKRINGLRRTPGAPVWQRNDHERIIRNEAALNRVRRYIMDNPARWTEDSENPARTL